MRLNPNFKRNTPKQMLMDFNCSAEQLYYDDLPYHPFCSDNVKEDGLHRLRRDKAVLKPTIQHNPDYLVRCLVFDIDKPKNANILWSAELHWYDCNAPRPNWIIINPGNGHAHYIYMLTTPVPITDAARLKPRNYVAAIERALKIKLKADIGYVGLVSKNPLHEQHNVIQSRSDTYSLEELAVIELNQLPKLKKRESEGLGRHCILFDELRWWSYSHVNIAKETMGFQQWCNSLLAKASALNTFNNPLPDSSLSSTVKSVARWTWTKYTGRGDGKKRGRDASKNHQLELGDKQTYAAIKTNEQRKQTTERKIAVAIHALRNENKKTSIRAIASKSGMSTRTIQAHKNVVLRCTSDNLR